MVGSLLRTLLLHQNPWLADPGRLRASVAERLPAQVIPRRAAAGVRQAIAEHPDRAHLIVGPRQAGKSTLVWALVAERPGPLLFLNCEEPLVREWCRSPGLFLADLDEWLPPGGLLFLEEAQWLDEAGLFLKGLVDGRIGRTLVATGSASFHLLARTRESLAGRATRHHVWPLSLVEVAPPISGQVPAAHRAVARRAVEKMLVRGGYPRAWSTADPAGELSELAAAFVLRDASDRFRIARPDALRKLLALVAGQVGDLVRYSEWARILGIAGTTVADYVALLEETHVLCTVRPFLGGKRAEFTQAPKVYYLDNGLRNTLAGGFEHIDRRSDVGKLLENWVFSELHKRFPGPGDVRYWRTRGGAEVDFVLEPGPARLVGVEVKATTADRPRLSRSTRSFIEAYAPERMLIVHQGEEGRMDADGTKVEFVPAERFPWVLDELAPPPA